MSSRLAQLRENIQALEQRANSLYRSIKTTKEKQKLPNARAAEERLNALEETLRKATDTPDYQFSLSARDSEEGRVLERYLLQQALARPLVEHYISVLSVPATCHGRFYPKTDVDEASLKQAIDGNVPFSKINEMARSLIVAGYDEIVLRVLDYARETKKRPK
jgi:chemotaxis methyl-accepting protein methylase